MTFILDMATGAELRRAAPGCRGADTNEAYRPARDRGKHVELRLEPVASTSPDRRSAISQGVNIAELISNIED